MKKTHCEICGKELIHAPARFDGEATFVGYLPHDCNPLANPEGGKDVIEDKELFETGVRDGFDGWQVWFRIDHQVFFLQPVAVSVKDEENTEEKARWIEKSLIPALERLANKKHKL